MPFRLVCLLFAAGVIPLLSGCHALRTTSGERQTLLLEDAAEAALEMRATALAHHATAIVHLMNDDIPEATKEFDLATQNDPDNEALVLEVSRRLLELRQAEAARQIVERAAARPKASVELIARLGFIYTQLGQTTNAIAANRRALELQPDAFGVRQNLYLTQAQARQSAAALATLDEGARRPRVTPDQLIELAGLYQNFAQQFPTQRELAQARTRAILERASSTPNLSAASRLKLADRYHLLNDTTNSMTLYRKLTQDYAEVPAMEEFVRSRLVDAYLRQKDQTNAIAELQTIVRENPSNDQAYYTLGSLASEQRDWTNAVTYLGKAVELAPKREQAYYDLAVAQMAIDESSAALATLDRARNQFPGNFVIEYLEGMARSQREEFSLAVLAFSAAERSVVGRESARLNHVFYFQFATACERSGDYARGVQLLEKCLSLQPDYAEALNYLGYLWADRGEHLERARELIERALKAEPDNAAFLDSMGWVLFRLKQSEAALDYLQRALKAESKADPTVLDHLGDVYSALGRHKEAREAWSKSLSLEPNDSVRRKLEAKPPH